MMASIMQFVLFGVLSLSLMVVAQSSDPSNKCGPKNNNWGCFPLQQNGGPCCSGSGFCGSTSDYCGTGCQKDFGTCNVPKKIDGVGTFIHTEDYTFSANAAFPSGLHKSTEFHEDTKNPDLKAKYDQQYTPDNAKVVGDTLALYVQGPPHQNPVKCGQVTTINQKIMYGSFRVRAKLSNEPGVVNGMFFIRASQSRCDEADIEYLPDPNSPSNPSKPPPLLLTNQVPDCTKRPATTTSLTVPRDMNTTFHDYQIDWVPGKVMYSVDGGPKTTLSKDVPTSEGLFIVNLWTNGDEGFSRGPPAREAVMYIQSISLAYNMTSDTQR